MADVIDLPEIDPGLWDRFWSKVDAADCWEWTGAGRNTGHGYGIVTIGRAAARAHGVQRNWQAHRVAWMLLVGPIPAGMHLDHLCKNPACVNPDHLEPVTPAENTRRGAAGMRNVVKWREVTECKRGHPFSPENTVTQVRKRGTIKRACRTCLRVAQRDWHKRRAAAA